MQDQIRDDSFEPKVREYGGARLQDDKKELMELPPKYALYERQNVLKFKVILEITLNLIRWNRQIERMKEAQTEKRGISRWKIEFF